MNIVAVTVDSSHGLYLSLHTLVKPGDKVIPFAVSDLYVNQITLAGRIPVHVPWRTGDGNRKTRESSVFKNYSNYSQLTTQSH
eukprot:CCRYP_012096-RA/>CCRYP_012096-RA protein AED:0.34 eAED:0.34 QI:0/0/0/1/0/0/2/0/82